MMIMSLKQAILATFEYGKGFGVKYSLDDIKQRLIGEKVYQDDKIETECRNIIDINQTDIKPIWEKEKIKKAEYLAKTIGKRNHFILFIGITGSVAAGYPDKEADIDLMIVTQKDTLWLTRLWLRWWVWKNNIPHRKFGAKEKNNEFCFNLWLEEDSLKIPKQRQNLRNAMDLVLIRPVWDSQEVYKRLVWQNPWVSKFVATGYQKVLSEVGTSKNNYINIKTSLGTSFLNRICYLGQYWYMKRKVNNELIDIKRAFFHPVTNGARI